METYSSGGGRRKHYVSRADIENLKKGGIKALEIKAKADAHHLNTEIPNAEKVLEENIQNAFNSKNENKNKKDTHLNNSDSSKNWFKKIIEAIVNFINKIFFPPNK